MPKVYLPGERVVSPDFGVGTVRRTAANGAVVYVHFDAIESVQPVPAGSLRDAIIDSGPELPSSPPPLPAFPEGSGGGGPLDTRRLAVECLRQGLPPPGSLISWTFGHRNARVGVEKAIRQAIDGKGSVLLVRAPYGQGKSHLGRLARELAAEHGLLTMHVELDGRGLSMRDGAGLVAALLSSTQLPSEENGDGDHRVRGFATLLRRAAPRARNGLPGHLEAFEPFMDRPSRWVENEEAVEALELYLAGQVNATDSSRRFTELLGEKVKLATLRMSSGTVEGRREAQAQQLVRVAELGVLAGAKGALVVVDELDHDVLNDHDGRVSAMLASLAEAVRGGPVVLLLLARDSEEEQEVQANGSAVLVLQDLSDADVEKLIHKAIDAFAAAFPSPVFESGRDKLVGKLKKRFQEEYQLLGWGPRYFVRATIEACDLARISKVESLARIEV